MKDRWEEGKYDNGSMELKEGRMKGRKEGKYDYKEAGRVKEKNEAIKGRE